MITGDLKSKIDRWKDFWPGCISNPLEVMEQLTYLLFIKDSTRSRPSPEQAAPAKVAGPRDE